MHVKDASVLGKARAMASLQAAWIKVAGGKSSQSWIDARVLIVRSVKTAEAGGDY